MLKFTNSVVKLSLQSMFWITFNPFVPNALFLYHLKTSENFMVFWCFQGVEKGYIGNNCFKWGYPFSLLAVLYKSVFLLLFWKITWTAWSFVQTTQRGNSKLCQLFAYTTNREFHQFMWWKWWFERSRKRIQQKSFSSYIWCIEKLEVENKFHVGSFADILCAKHRKRHVVGIRVSI